jgi:response regulator RpfG family c-di-GMP phosphodiesterase
LFISDFRMPEMDGIEFLKGAKALQPDAARLILSGYADLNALLRAVNEVGIERFIGKPWNDYDLMSAIGQALAHRELLLENRELANLVRLEMGDKTRGASRSRAPRSNRAGDYRGQLGAGWLGVPRPRVSAQRLSHARAVKITA